MPSEQPPDDEKEDEEGDDDAVTDSDSSSNHDWSDTEESENDEPLEPAQAIDRETRRKERDRALAAAGLILNEDIKPPPRPRRPAPATPRRRAPRPPKALPPVPADDPAEAAAADDAFGRYEAYKQSQSNNNRLSVASFDTTSTTQTFPAPISPSQSSQENRSYSHILNFLGRRAPGSEDKDNKRPVISGPILQQPDSDGRENSPAFGSSWTTLIDRSVLEDIPKAERRRQEVRVHSNIGTSSHFILGDI